MRSSPIAAVVAAGVLVLAPVAGAKSPPRGDYGCTFTTFSGTFGAGILNIKSKTKYSVNDEGKGRYKTRGKRINFKSGDYKGLYYGIWSRAKGSVAEISLRGKKDGEEKLICTHDGS